MKILRTGMMCLLATMLLWSCQKERSFAEDAQNNNNSSGNNDDDDWSSSEPVELIGTWRFVGIVAETGSITEIAESGSVLKMESILNYTGSNTGGTTTFTASEMTTNNIEYDFEGTSVTKIYQDGALTANHSLPHVGYTPPTSGTDSYTRVGNDSLTFSSQTVITPTVVPGIVTVNMGVKVRMSNDTLYMRVRFNDPVSMPDPSITGSMRIFGDIIYALKK